MRADGNLLPFPTMTVQKRVLRGCELAVLVVYPSDSPPVRFNGRTWIRVGPRRATATPEEERRLTEKRRGRDVPFDLHVVAPASLDDLDLELFQRGYLPAALAPELLAQNSRSVEQQLASLRFTTLDGVPTVVGLLVVGNDPKRFLPGAYIQFLRFEGTRLTDPIKDQKELDGPLPELARALDEVFHAHITVTSDITTSPREIRRADYPIVALQQLAHNAVLHRVYEGTNAPVRLYWYSDRVEILSPGGPFGQVTAENFGQPGVTDYRNPSLAEAMKNLGLVQRFGIGIELARQALAENSNPPPEFTVEPARVLAVIRKSA
jgi:ATP-dependent DNA helicase RecG